MTAKESTATESIAILNVPDPTSFDDRSALNVKSNLKSQQYQDFIHQLYRFDKDNLKRVDSLFEQVTDQRSSSSANDDYGRNDGAGSDSESNQPSYADYIQSQPVNYIGISQQDSSKRFKRSPQGAIFRPLFVYRIFQERIREREEKRAQQRLLAQRRRASSYLKNEIEQLN